MVLSRVPGLISLAFVKDPGRAVMATLAGQHGATGWAGVAVAASGALSGVLTGTPAQGGDWRNDRTAAVISTATGRRLMDQLRFDAGLGYYSVSVARTVSGSPGGWARITSGSRCQVGIPQVDAVAGRLLCLETTLYALQSNGPRAPLASMQMLCVSPRLPCVIPASREFSHRRVRRAGLASPQRAARPAGTNGHPAGRCVVTQPVRRRAAGAPGCRPAARRRPRSRAPLDLPTG